MEQNPRPQNRPGYKHKQHNYNYKQRQHGGGRFKRFCIHGHDKLAPHGIHGLTDCAVCKREWYNKAYQERRISRALGRKKRNER